MRKFFVMTRLREIFRPQPIQHSHRISQIIRVSTPLKLIPFFHTLFRFLPTRPNLPILTPIHLLQNPLRILLIAYIHRILTHGRTNEMRLKLLDWRVIIELPRRIVLRVLILSIHALQLVRSELRVIVLVIRLFLIRLEAWERSQRDIVDSISLLALWKLVAHILEFWIKIPWLLHSVGRVLLILLRIWVTPSSGWRLFLEFLE